MKGDRANGNKRRMHFCRKKLTMIGQSAHADNEQQQVEQGSQV
jgi:hypothetical protein